jgi:hypothetical protein
MVKWELEVAGFAPACGVARTREGGERVDHRPNKALPAAYVTCALSLETEL